MLESHRICFLRLQNRVSNKILVVTKHSLEDIDSMPKGVRLVNYVMPHLRKRVF